MSSAPPHYHTAASSPRYPSDTVAHLLGSDRPSICDLLATLEVTRSHLHKNHNSIADALATIAKQFDKQQFWCLLTEDQRRKLLKMVREDEVRIQDSTEKGYIPQKELTPKMRNATALFKEFGLGTVTARRWNYSSDRPELLSKELRTVQQQVFPNDEEWRRAGEAIFTHTVFMDLYPPEAYLLNCALQKMIRSPELKRLDPRPLDLLCFVVRHGIQEPVAPVDFELFLALEEDFKQHQRQHGVESNPAHLELLSSTNLHGLYDIDDKYQDYSSNGYMHNPRPHMLNSLGKADLKRPFTSDEHSLSHHNFLGLLTPRQAKRYGRSAAGGVWA